MVKLDTFVYDRRRGDEPEKSLQIDTDKLTLDKFKATLRKTFNINANEKFVVVNTNRVVIDSKAALEVLQNSSTLYILKSVDQALTAPTYERVEYIPHYDTLVKSGIYEYYASEGQDPLPFAFAELIDNSLAATATNEGIRKVEIRLMFDDALGKPAISVWDNGQGMTSSDLNNWAIYRLSKFNRSNVPSSKCSEGDTMRYLNSDISWFGVGGKQAIFFIGNATRMITKTSDCGDVHELCISKEEFERKEKLRESIYSGKIYNRRPGDCVHIAEEDENLRELIRGEENHKSFTSVVVTGINSSKVLYLRYHFDYWCQQLAHIYHYYLHGPQGNEIQSSRNTTSLFQNIDIQVVMYEKGKSPKRKALRDIDDDLQSQYIRNTASIFEFRAHCEGSAVVEGMLRYHPFLYDSETYPQMSLAKNNDEDDMDIVVDSRAPRGNRPIFECYWNGRLIPYTSIDCLEWCSPPKKRTNIPPECYNRFSGALWTNNAFQVSTNKLTFIDLEVKLKEKSTLFNRVILGQEQRAQISRAFNDWIKECHESHDKQVKFFNFKGIVKRSEFTQKHRQTPWSVFHGIEWDGKIFKTGDLVKTQRSLPVICGVIQRFLLYGDHDGDVFATGGEMEIIQQPDSLYGDKKVFSLVKLDRNTTAEGLKKFIDDEEAKLPHKLVIEWPSGDEVQPNSKVHAGSTIGDIRVDILNGKGESISKLPGDRGKRLLLEMKCILHEKGNDKVITQHVCQHGGKSWPYWFRKFSNITSLGPHTISLQVIVSDSSANKQPNNFPSRCIRFNVIEGAIAKFSVGVLEQPLRIASPFNIPLNFSDNFGNPTKPTKKFDVELISNGLEISHEGTQIKGTGLIIKNVSVLGKVPSNAGKDFNVKAVVSSINQQQSLKMRLLPGPPHSLVTDFSDGDIVLENGSPLNLNVFVKDKAGNLTQQPRLNVVCKLTGSSGLPSYSCDCSSTGKSTLSGENILISKMEKSIKLKAKIELQHFKDIAPIERIIVVNPSTRPARIEVLRSSSNFGKNIKLGNEEELCCIAGETISGLSFKIFDEGKRQMTIDNSLAAKIKVNWMNKVSRDLLKQGLLPDIKAPNTVNDTKFCQVSLGAALGVDFSFSLVPQPDKPVNIKCECRDAKIQLGDTLKHDVIVSFSDQYGNKIVKASTVEKLMTSVSADGLSDSIVNVVVNEDATVSIKNVQFNDNKVGIKELKIKFGNLVCYQRIEVGSGPPAILKIININTTQPIGVFNNTRLSKPLTLQLCDCYGNPCLDSNVKIVLNKDSGLKLNPTPSHKKTDEKGQVTFSAFEVSGERGVYQIRIKALIGRTSIDAEPITLRIDANPNKPVKIVVDHSKFTTNYIAGTALPDFSVHVLAEDDHVMKCNSKDFVMKLWSVDDNVTQPSTKAISYQPCKKTSSDKDNYYYFRGIPIPEQIGQYCFVLLVSFTGNVKLKSDVFNICVDPAPPVKLVPVGSLATPTVSNTQRATSRCLMKNTKFVLKDEYDNISGTSLNGKVEVVIKKPSQIDEVPMLLGNAMMTEFALINGTANVQNISIQQNTAGKDGQEYILSFSVQISGQQLDIPPFNLPFLFYNDVRKQEQSAQLTRERDHLFTTIKAYRALFETTKQLMDEMNVAVHEAGLAESKLRTELSRRNVPSQSLRTTQTVDDFISQLTISRNKFQNTPRRRCALNPGPRGEAGILGKVAHLAEVMDDDIARVLSWHLSGDMDCVITLTTEKAKKVYHESKGSQQVLPLDSIYKRSLPEWEKPLPHERGRVSYHPAGHPMYARSTLVFPVEKDNCKIVFGMLLGDTIILDNLDCANSYRQEVVKFTHCPTILTRTGDRIRSNGKFGGFQNRAPPMEKLRGAVFAAPYPVEYHTVCGQLEQLKAYKQAMTKHAQLQSDLKVQMEQMQTSEMQKKHRECRDAEFQLRRIEEKLGMTPTQYEIPASPSSMLQSVGNPSLTRSRITRSSLTTRSTPVISPTVSDSREHTPISQSNVANGTTPIRGRRHAATSDSYTSPSKRARRN
ncbi:structural maintenance of chromosomes flexible hinge domain-containing protein 1-like isoform X2 [Xenia sp. Carnegie-2017]|uniref:structural maintenance of chromosomes flexible hinge domain-containing protein 1-like isoform X2 n=1 Tax=Xenia sp. Carnegie-2017 TaxID=2897299 RepID=UPI001F048FA7|nr:structural maintenance of chromosomes flexible hinge domain-containing protein 1-like isoform X2 [Xenia sp. Carnegie-2017]